MTATAYEDTFAADNLPPRELWPEMCFDLPELHYPERLNCVVELLDRMAAHGCSGKVAIYSRGVCWTYAQLQAKVNRIAQVLRKDLRVKTGSRILLRGGNSPMMAACMLAVIKAG
jgi:2-aminobenzoate-CoA ligase